MTCHSHGRGARTNVRDWNAVWWGLVGAALCLFLAIGDRILAAGRFSQALTAFAAPGDYHLEKRDGRWSFIDPGGHRVFVRAVSQVDTSDFGGQGNFQSYDAVYLSTSDGWSRNLSDAAKNSLGADVINAQGVTVRAVGDAIYLGSERFKPISTYFWLNRLGNGGAISWYYSSANGRWSPINGNGNPSGGNEASAVLDADGGYSFDIGGYFQPNNNGFSETRGPNANRIVWWPPPQGPPADFSRTSLPKDRTPRYYIKGSVARGFVTAPVLNQAYERHQLIERILAKYGAGRGQQFVRWGQAMNSRLRAWGFNAAGQYSYRYSQLAPKLTDPLPTEPTWQLSGQAMSPLYRVKNVYAGAVCPPGSHDLVYQGRQADVFDPTFSRSLMDQAAINLSRVSRGSSFALIPEEADDLFGLNSATAHPHLGYIVLTQNPYVMNDTQKHVEYTDHKLYSKYALRDFLKGRYNGSVDALNRAWGTHYTTWETSSGDLSTGTNAWGFGTGFTDENGQHIYFPKGASCRAGTRIQYNFNFTNPAFPALRKDLDDFVEYFAQSYGKALAKALAQGPHPPVFLPLYRGPAMAYKGVAPYVDGFWVNEDEPQQLKKVYDETGRPVILADYATANPDSPLFFRGIVSSATYNRASEVTTISAPGVEYIFRAPWQVSFSDASVADEACHALKGLSLHPYVSSVRWNSFDLRGDYAGCIRPGTQVELFSWVGDERTHYRSQDERAHAMIERLRTALKLRGKDGVAFVVGFEHWSLYDNSPSDYGEIGDFGLATLEDNAYDGIEARRATGRDSRGYERGGEEHDYGDLIGPLSSYLKTVDERQ